MILETLEPRRLLSGVGPRSFTAVADSFSVQNPMGVATPTTLDVLANDTGGSGTPSITSVGSVPYGTVSIQSPTTSGGRSTLLFTSSSGYTGTESFNYTATDAAGSSSTATVTVTVSNGAGSAPVVAGLSTSSGSTLGGGSLTVNGTGFNSVSNVMFGTVACSTFTVNSPTQITVTPPAHTAGTVDVIVVTSMGSSSLSSSDQYSFQAPVGLPTVTGVSPGTASISGGTVVTITGTNFSNLTGINFGSTPATSYTLASLTSIQATAPSHVAGQVDVTVTTNVGTSATASTDTITYTTPTLAPSVTGLSASSGSTAGGNTINILGANFTSVTGVNFGSFAATSFTVSSANAISVVVPAGVAGAVNVTVTNSAGTSTAGTASQYTFVSSVPIVTGLSVASGSVNGGTTVTITGTNLSGVTSVLFGAVAASQFTVLSPTSIVVVTPAATLGVCDITVQSPNGTSATSAADQFTFLAPPPTITGLSAASGVIAGGTTVTLSGARLASATGVLFGTTPATSFVVNADGSVTAVSPAEPLGTVDVTVTSPSGTSATGSADQFAFVNPPPIVTSLSVQNASVAGGETITIHGLQFVGATSVLVGNLLAPSFTVTDDHTISFITPTASAGTLDVTVSNSSGQSATSSADQLTFVNTAPGGSVGVAAPNVQGVPVVTGLNPSSSGGTVTLYGAGFNGAAGVSFGNVAASSYQIVSDNQIVATVPTQTMGTVNVTVQSAAGSSAATGASQFTPATTGLAPAVSSTTQAPGTSGAGSLLTITGSNFTGTTGLTIGGQPAVYVVQSPTTILAQVPAGVSGSVNVAVTNGSGTSSSSFGSQVTVGSHSSGGSSGGSGSSGSGSSSVNPDYVVPDSAGTPTIGPSGNAAGSTGPASIPTAPAVPTIHPVTTTTYGSGNTATGDQIGMLNVTTTTTDIGTITSSSSTVNTLANGAVETITTTMTEIVSYYSTISRANRVLVSSALDESLQTVLLTSDVLVAADGTGFSQFSASTTTMTYRTSSSAAAFSYSTSSFATTMSSDFEVGVSSSSAKDSVTASVVQSNTTSSSSSGSSTSGGPISGNFAASSFGNDMFSRSDTYDDTNIVPPDSSSGSSGTGTGHDPNLPVVSGLLVTGGTTSGGTTVQISGNHFLGATAVLFGGVSALSFKVVSDQLIIAVAPPEAQATVHVTVVGPAGASIATNNDLYSYLNSSSTLYVIHDFQTMTGSDSWQSYSTGSMTFYANGSEMASESHGGTSSGNDTYLISDLEKSLSVGTDATGATSLYDSVTLSDTGFDEYQFSNLGTIALATDGTLTATDAHTNSDDGREHTIMADVGWQQSDETLSDGTGVDYHDNFTDSFDDSSTYTDSDIYSAGTANGGSGTISSTSTDSVKFNSSDQVDETDTVTNSVGTPTVARTIDVSSDVGTLSDSSVFSDIETVGAGEANLGDAITFSSSASESDIALDSLSMTITANGPVSATESMSLSEGVTSTSHSASGSTFSDSGTAAILPSGTTESDTMTVSSSSSDSSVSTDTLTSSDTVTGADGSTSTVSVTGSSVDTSSGGSSSSLVDVHTENPAAAGSSSSTPVVGDDVTFSDSVSSSDAYTQTGGSSITVTVPITGGSSSITASSSLLASGTATYSATDSGETNSGNPAVNQETDTLSVTNVDSGSTTSNSTLSIHQTDPATGVVTTISSSDVGSSTFSDDDGLSFVSILVAGSTTASQTGASHAISSEGYTDTTTLSINVNGSPSNGVTVDESELMIDTATGGDTITDRETLTGNIDTGLLTFSSDENDTITDSGHANVTNSVSSSDGSGNSASMSDSSHTSFTDSGSLHVVAQRQRIVLVHGRSADERQ